MVDKFLKSGSFRYGSYLLFFSQKIQIIKIGLYDSSFDAVQRNESNGLFSRLRKGNFASLASQKLKLLPN